MMLAIARQQQVSVDQRGLLTLRERGDQGRDRARLECHSGERENDDFARLRLALQEFTQGSRIEVKRALHGWQRNGRPGMFGLQFQALRGRFRIGVPDEDNRDSLQDFRGRGGRARKSLRPAPVVRQRV